MTSDDERKRLMHGSFELHKELEAANARIRELEAELDALKSDLSGYMSAANTYVNELHGVHAGTHVIVPVEPTEAMAKAIHAAIDEAWDHPDVAVCLYRAMIRAAQPDASD